MFGPSLIHELDLGSVHLTSILKVPEEGDGIFPEVRGGLIGLE